MHSPPNYDVVVCGASLAGSTAATLLARQGLRVALLERATDPNSYKKVCTHFIQPSATPTLQRLGVVEQLESAGAVRNSMDMYTRFGWIEHSIEAHGYSIRRQVIDPLLRKTAAATPGVELLMGHTVTGLVREAGRVVGVRGEAGERTFEFRADLVVAADGRHSKIAQLAEVPAVTAPNNRFIYFAYYRGLRMPAGHRSLYWLLDPDAAYCFPNEDGLVLVAAQPHKDRLPEFRGNIEEAYLRYFDRIPDAPNLRTAERVSDIMGMLEMPNHVRPAAAAGLAFVGDAALTGDPLFGVGCGWALQSGEWLADTVGPALVAHRDVDQALEAYKAQHADQLHGHHDLINMASVGHKFGAIEKLLFTAAARDRGFAHDFSLLNTRLLHPRDIIGPKMLLRAAWASLTRRLPQRPAGFRAAT